MVYRLTSLNSKIKRKAHLYYKKILILLYNRNFAQTKSSEESSPLLCFYYIIVFIPLLERYALPLFTATIAFISPPSKMIIPDI